MASSTFLQMLQKMLSFGHIFQRCPGVYHVRVQDPKLYNALRSTRHSSDITIHFKTSLKIAMVSLVRHPKSQTLVIYFEKENATPISKFPFFTAMQTTLMHAFVLHNRYLPSLRLLPTLRMRMVIASVAALQKSATENPMLQKKTPLDREYV